MKLTMLLLTAGILNVCAKGVSQNVTFSGENVPLKSVFSSLKKQTGFLFLYTGNVIRLADPVTVNVKDLPLQQFLDEIFKLQPLRYDIKGKNVFISRKDKSPTFIHPSEDEFLPPVPIRGRVLDDNGQPLAGASILVKNSKTSGMTNAEGVFTINVNEGDVLVISYVEHQTKEIKITSQNINLGRLSITLLKSTSQLEEVVINKGYYTESKKLSAGNVGTVNSKDIQRQPISNPLMALAGRVPGLTVTQASGTPGAEVIVRVRGMNSISQGSAPLYIVDGVPFGQIPFPSTISSNTLPSGITSPLITLNPADIESIEVLKDADATAIYGSRGANGVILITTKKGKAGSAQLDINVYSGTGHVTRKPEMLNTQQYVAMRKEAFSNDGTIPTTINASDIMVWDTTRYTDWVDYFIGGSANIHDAQLKISGGNLNNQFSIGGGLHSESMVIPHSSPTIRGSGNFTFNHRSLNNRFIATLSTMFTSTKIKLPNRDFFRNVSLIPNAPALIDSAGKLVWSEKGLSFTNPISFALQKYTSVTKNLTSNMVLQYRVIKDLNLKLNLGYSDMQFNETQINPKTSFNPIVNAPSGAKFGKYSTNNWIIEPNAEYSINIGGGKLGALVGATWQETNGSGFAINATNFVNDNLLNSPAAAANITVTPFYNGNTIKYHYQAVFGRLNYNLDNKYLVNLTGRRDGSSRFGPGKQFANFGAAGIAWIFSEENFIKRAIPFLNFGKLRASYGTTGNDQIGDYQFLNTWGSPTLNYPYQGISGLMPLRLYNPNYAWEINRKLELALEMGFMEDRIFITSSFFLNRSGNQLIDYSLPDQTGFSSILMNFPAVVRNSGWEFQLNTVNLKRKTISWRSSFNLTISPNKLVSFPGLDSSSYAYLYTIGKSINSSKLLHNLGVDPETGLYKFNGNGVYPFDATSIVDYTPKYFAGLINNFQWKGFELDFLFQYVKQQGNLIGAFPQSPGTRNNQPLLVLDRWRKPGDMARFQRYTATRYTSHYSDFAFSSDGAITDASYLRLKNVSLYYTLPDEWIKKIKMTSLRVYLLGQNLLTFTGSMYKNYDPENNTTVLFMPPLKMLTAGLQFTF